MSKTFAFHMVWMFYHNWKKGHEVGQKKHWLEDVKPPEREKVKTAACHCVFHFLNPANTPFWSAHLTYWDMLLRFDMRIDNDNCIH